MKTLSVSTRARQEVQDLSGQVASLVAASGVAEGLCHVFVPHTTAGVTVNENADPDVKRDILYALGKLAPDDPGFRHAEGNSPAHLKSVLTGSSVLIPVTGGRMELGSWGGIYFCEFDGPRQRRVCVRVFGEDAAGKPRLL